MKKLEAVANGTKDAWLWGADFVSAHPHATLLIIIGLVAIVVLT